MNRCEWTSAGEGSTMARRTNGVNSTVSRLAVDGGREVVPEFVVRRYAHTDEQAQTSSHVNSSTDSATLIHPRRLKEPKHA
jgi:hypothetical protein